MKNQINPALNNIIELEKKVILNFLKNPEICKRLSLTKGEMSDEDINLLLIEDGCHNLAFQAHKFIISKIIYESYFKKSKISASELAKYFNCFKKDFAQLNFDIDTKKLISKLGRKEIPTLLEMFHINYLNAEFVCKDGKLYSSKSKINFKSKGAVYTDAKIAEKITYQTIKNKISQGFPKEKLRILDFGCGTGRFYLSALNYLSKFLGIDKREAVSKHLFGIDTDSLAIDILKSKVLTMLNSNSIEDLKLLSKNLVNKNMLITTNDTDREPSRVSYDRDFKEVLSDGGFNIIISNPPYFLLKINRKEKMDLIKMRYYKCLMEKMKNEISFFKKSGLYKYSLEGMLNYYKLSIEMILNLADRGAEIGIICPSTIFSDITSKKLRKHILLENNVREINYFRESERLFHGISQSLVIFYLQKSGVTDKIDIRTNGDKFSISLDLIRNSFGNNYEIPYVKQIGWDILAKLSKFKKLKDFSFIRNKRGELDLTLYKNFITKQNTGWRLVRGNMLSKNGIIETNGEYVLIEQFLNKKSKDYVQYDFNKKRLVCQQISNVDILKRLNFVICDEKDIISNSCNYITVMDDRDDIIKIKLGIILNSFILNWRFKVTSSNNHISNYELDQLPIVDIEKIPLGFKDDALKNELIIEKMFGMNISESLFILKDIFDAKEIKKIWRESG